MWSISYCSSRDKNSIKSWLDNLNDEQFKSVGKELALLKRCGNGLRLPHSRSLGQGLFELRKRNYGFRIYYTFSHNHTIVLLRSGGKTNQEKDIDTARKKLTILQQNKNEVLYEN